SLLLSFYDTAPPHLCSLSLHDALPISQQRFEPDLVVRVGKKIDQPRHPSARLLRVAVHGIPFRAAVPLQRRHGVSHVRRLDVLPDRKSTRLNSSHGSISYAVFCLKKKK